MDRRTFLQWSSLAGLSLLSPSLWAKANAPKAEDGVKTLVLVELKGGNDGLNTLIPYADKLYYKHRPRLAIPAKEIITLDNSVGMHPALAPLHPLWQAKQMAWLQGVGYPDPVRSHFRAIDIWDTATMKDSEDTEGWVARELSKDGLEGVAVDCSLGPLFSKDLSTVGLVNPKQFARMGKALSSIAGNESTNKNPALRHVLQTQNSVDRLAEKFFEHIGKAPEPGIPYPKGIFARDLQYVHQLIAAGLNIPAFKVSLGGFDTHTNQLRRHAQQLKTLAEALAVFAENLKNDGTWDNTLIMTYSEFGRRVEENGSQGTDHGSAAPHFVLGGKVKGSLYGKYPSLEQLDKRGDLVYTTDFRDIYQSVVHNWWNPSSQENSNLLNFIEKT